MVDSKDVTFSCITIIVKNSSFNSLVSKLFLVNRYDWGSELGNHLLGLRHFSCSDLYCTYINFQYARPIYF